MVSELSPEHLRAGDLVAALRRIVDVVGSETSIRTALDVLGAPRPLGTDVDVVLLRTAQEGLANVRRHSAADSAQVTIDYDDPSGGVRLRIEDDGRGFTESDDVGGFGLAGLRARLAQIGGRLIVESAAGAGTRLTAWVPASTVTASGWGGE